MGTNPDDGEDRREPPPEPYTPTYRERRYSGFEERDEPLAEPFEEPESSDERDRGEGRGIR